MDQRPIPAVLMANAVAYLRSKYGGQILDILPSGRSLLIVYSLRHSNLLEEATLISASLQAIWSKGGWGHSISSRLWRMPVFYGPPYGLDWDEALQVSGLDAAQWIAAHSSARYEVAAMGFSPGFAYLDGLPSPLSLPRLSRPRIQVAAGTLGIAQNRCAVYPLDGPGGWKLVGMTALRLGAGAGLPMWELGDEVCFVPVNDPALLSEPFLDYHG
jgi:KipI family sensor histidine kinase inhibitor